MFSFIGIREQLLKERQKNSALREKLNKADADIEYLAMMSGVEMAQEEERDNEVTYDE